LRWRVLTLLAVFALVVAACSSDDSEDTTTTEAAQEETTTTAAAEETTTTAGEATETTEAAQPAEGQLAGLSVVDENTFTVELTEANAEFPLTLNYAAYYALPDAFYDDPAAFDEAPIGNGAFMMDGVWEHDVSIPLKANPDYQGPDPAKIDSWEFVIFADINTGYNEALAGNLDVLDNVPPDFLASAPVDFGDAFKQSPNTIFNYLGFPTYLENFTKEHRQALSMAVDRELILEKIFNGQGEAAHSAVPTILGGRAADVCDSWNLNPEMAKELWDAAGDPGPITIWFNSGSGHEDWVEAIVNMWGEVLGLDTSTVSFEQREWADYLPIIQEGDELNGPFRLAWGMDYPSPLNFLEPLYASYNTFAQGGANYVQYDNPDFDALLAEGKAAVAATGLLEDGIPAYEAAEDLLCDDSQILPVRFGLNSFVHSDDVSEVYVDAFNDPGFTEIESQDGDVTAFLIEPATLIPTDSNESEGIKVGRALWAPLLDFDPINNEPFFSHAESVTSDDGGTTWTIVLNPGWTFHDGTPVTAESYVKAWNYGADATNAQQNASFYKQIVGFDVLNPDTGEGDG